MFLVIKRITFSIFIFFPKNMIIEIAKFKVQT